MTLPPQKLGDQGQRYAVWTRGYPQDGDKAIQFSDSYDTACSLADNWVRAPGCVKSWVIDREDNYTEVWGAYP